MQARTISFIIDRDHLQEVLAVFDDEFLPRYLEMPNFLGLLLLDSAESRGEVLGVSVWDHAMSDSDGILSEFRQRLFEIAGCAPTSKSYDVVGLVVSPPGGTGPVVVVQP